MRAAPLSSYALTVVVLATAIAGATGTLPRRSANGRLMEPHLTAAGVRAYELLALSATFAHGTSGSGVAPQVCAVQTLLREPKGGEAFRALYLEPSLVANLYGLVGIWHRDPGQFDRNVNALARAYADVKIPTRSDCTGSKRTVREVLYAEGALQIAAGTPSSQIALPDEFRSDVAGGLVPLELAHYFGCD